VDELDHAEVEFLLIHQADESAYKLDQAEQINVHRRDRAEMNPIRAGLCAMINHSNSGRRAQYQRSGTAEGCTRTNEVEGKHSNRCGANTM
jgi:hypothetical protein